jgi:glycosyltransferase involved in cell wall biosynthesis
LAPPVAVVLKGYPRLSETFIAQEILGLERAGVEVRIIALRQPTEGKVHDLHQAILAPVLYLPEYLRDAPWRVTRAVIAYLSSPRFWSVCRIWLRDLHRDPTANRIRRLGQALVLATELGPDVGHIHAHYLHTPGSVARYAAMLRGLPLSLSAHAKDVWTIPDWEKREKLDAAAWTVTCSRFNFEHLQALAPQADLALLYHGLDLNRFPPPRRGRGPDGSDPKWPVRIVSVARAVEKKGLDILLQALALLPPELHWRFDHLGGGQLAGALAEEAQRLGLGGRVVWHGAVTQVEVVTALRQAHIFCLPVRVARDGDRDGLPNAIMEAMALELPVLATRVAAIPEVVREGATGRLVPPDDAPALATELADLMVRPTLRAEMGRIARRHIAERFTAEHGIAALATRFGRERAREAA